METALAASAADRSTWVRRARRLAYVTVAYNLVEGAVSIAFGAADESVALLGFGADSLIEVGSAGLVLWRFGDGARTATPEGARRDRLASRGIGFLFLGLAAATAAGAAARLWEKAPPETALAGLVISAVSLSFMFFLWAAKLRAARALDSATLRGDAACSLACIQLSAVLFAGSVAFTVAPALWWADAAAALALAALIAREGWGIARASFRADAGAGCGCPE